MRKVSTITISRINELLKQQGRRQIWLANQLNVTPAYLNWLLRGKRTPKTLRDLLERAEKILTN